MLGRAEERHDHLARLDHLLRRARHHRRAERAAGPPRAAQRRRRARPLAARTACTRRTRRSTVAIAERSQQQDAAAACACVAVRMPARASGTKRSASAHASPRERAVDLGVATAFTRAPLRAAASSDARNTSSSVERTGSMRQHARAARERGGEDRIAVVGVHLQQQSRRVADRKAPVDRALRSVPSQRPVEQRRHSRRVDDSRAVPPAARTRSDAGHAHVDAQSVARVSSRIEPCATMRPFCSTTTSSQQRSTSGSRCEHTSRLFPCA